MKFIAVKATERIEGQVFIEDLREEEGRDLGPEILVPRSIYTAINNIYFMAMSNVSDQTVKLKPGTQVGTICRTKDFDICVKKPA